MGKLRGKRARAGYLGPGRDKAVGRGADRGRGRGGGGPMPGCIDKGRGFLKERLLRKTLERSEPDELLDISEEP